MLLDINHFKNNIPGESPRTPLSPLEVFHTLQTYTFSIPYYSIFEKAKEFLIIFTTIILFNLSKIYNLKPLVILVMWLIES